MWQQISMHFGRSSALCPLCPGCERVGVYAIVARGSLLHRYLAGFLITESEPISESGVYEETDLFELNRDTKLLGIFVDAKQSNGQQTCTLRDGSGGKNQQKALLWKIT